MKKLDCDTKIIGIPNRTVCDFWAWAYSDILSNANRGVFAEYLVAHALGADGKVRIGWDAYDCLYKGNGIEVKSAAYLQSWDQKGISIISFDIAKKRSWYAETNTYSKEASRPSFCYVFGLLKETNKTRVNPLDLSQWEFYVLSTAFMDREYQSQQRIGLSALQKVCNPVAYDDLKDEIDRLMRDC